MTILLQFSYKNMKQKKIKNEGEESNLLMEMKEEKQNWVLLQGKAAISYCGVEEKNSILLVGR